MEQYRLVATPEGPITYRLVKKRVNSIPRSRFQLSFPELYLLIVKIQAPEKRAN